MVDINGQYFEAFDICWSQEYATGMPCSFRPLHTVHVAKQTEGNIYFAGEHLSRHHTRTADAIDSAIQVMMQIQGEKEIQALGSEDNLECIVNCSVGLLSLWKCGGDRAVSDATNGGIGTSHCTQVIICFNRTCPTLSRSVQKFAEGLSTVKKEGTQVVSRSADNGVLLDTG
ncbi:uncharacterized protein BP01DRAFT_366572 [Aspergillus saccharolyticus JOP 1030-1]|uniref:Uncharacterized protein n=1 Tax=Aspergillus saccharolyticus JOP 1030-1 TaxID=1450539 RepID=A0A318ZAW9_9EURO|nr:hypothetical protein BP01DRAFT_366572 [Aspergillus saccharolyticus JOP 1030-1]PYH44439.1 hypothetical protein BP01DRAFT_366572 [Aspergillus saccharolyticus JOP 1030-1]